MSDFSARATAWMDTRTDPRGEELMSLIDTLLEVANTGSKPTFVGIGKSSIVDVTLESGTLIQKIQS